jgi:hypothetical protein
MPTNSPTGTITAGERPVSSVAGAGPAATTSPTAADRRAIEVLISG